MNGNRDRRFIDERRRSSDYFPAPPAFNVLTDVPHLKAWYRADTVVLATGVSQLTDKSGNGYHYLQATGGKQPAQVLAASDPNGFDCVVSDGVDDGMVHTGFGALTGLTFFVVSRSIVTPAATGNLICIGNSSAAQSVQVIVATSGAFQTRYQNPGSTATTYNFGVTAPVSGSDIIVSSVVASTQTNVLTGKMGNVPVGSQVSTNATPSTIASIASGLFASQTAAAQYLAAGLYELIVCDDVLTDAEVSIVNQGLITSYELF